MKCSTTENLLVYFRYTFPNQGFHYQKATDSHGHKDLTKQEASAIFEFIIFIKLVQRALIAFQ